MKKSWFSLVKRLFIWDSNSTQDKNKEKRRRWIFGRVKKKRLPSIAAPPPPPPPTTTATLVSEAEEEESKKHALTVAIASAAAAAEVVRLTGVPQSSHKPKHNSEESDETRDVASHSISQCQRNNIKEFAAIKIQTAFRGYLHKVWDTRNNEVGRKVNQKLVTAITNRRRNHAKKALRALKGIVKLQAIIRGRAVRRQAMSTLKCLQSIVSIQSQVCARRLKMVEGSWDYCTENEEMHDSKDKIIRMDSNSERKWSDSTLLKEEVDASCIIKKEAVHKRERIKEYSFNHRRSAESERSKVNGRWRYWLEQWVDTQLSKSKELEDLDSVFSSNSRGGEEYYGGRQLKLRNMHRQQSPFEGLDSPIVSSRKVFTHRKQCSVGENQSFSSSSPATPAYMAATESARAKARSTSSPRVRTGHLDSDSSYSPCKKKLSVVSNVNSEVLSNNGRNGNKFGGCNQQRSPSFKGLPLPIKSSRTIIKDLSINSDCSLPNWDNRQSSFK